MYNQNEFKSYIFFIPFPNYKPDFHNYKPFHITICVFKKLISEYDINNLINIIFLNLI